MDIRISFPGGKRVIADLGTHVVETDQSVAHGGESSAPEPFDLFLASLATCAGIYVLGFCQARGIPTDGIELVQHHDFEQPTRRLARVALEVILPLEFPEKYRAAVERAAAGCKVKKTLASPPEITVTTTVRRDHHGALRMIGRT
jgi:ribosomal protein S12 methylthiotransferase accessory factor